MSRLVKTYIDPEKGTVRLARNLSGAYFVVMKLFDIEQRELWTIKVWKGTLESVSNYWNTKEVTRAEFIEFVGDELRANNLIHELRTFSRKAGKLLLNS